MVSSTLFKCLSIASICSFVSSFVSQQAVSKEKAYITQLRSAIPHSNHNYYDDSSYFNTPTSAADEIRWGMNVNSRFTRQRNIASSMPTEAEILAAEEQTRITQTLQAAKQAFRDSREIEAYNLINDLEKGSRRMDGPTRSRLAGAQPITSMEDVKERYPIATSNQIQQQQKENFVFQYSEAEPLDLQRSFDDLVDGNVVDYALIRAAALAGKQAAHVVGGNDPENWID
jgi:hypothetical protein